MMLLLVLVIQECMRLLAFADSFSPGILLHTAFHITPSPCLLLLRTLYPTTNTVPGLALDTRVRPGSLEVF